MCMKPIGGRVIIQPIKEEPKTKSGIILSEASTKKKISKGKITHVGKDVELVKVGDIVLYSPFYYDEIDEETITIEEKDIWAIVQ